MSQNDVAAVVKLIEERDDIAAVMFEPSGASWGQAPLPPGFIQAVRDATRKKGVVMLMDEVITGYRWSSGGVARRGGSSSPPPFAHRQRSPPAACRAARWRANARSSTASTMTPRR